MLPGVTLHEVLNSEFEIKLNNIINKAFISLL